MAGGNIVTHFGWSRPISEIRKFLRENKFGFILGDKDIPKEDPKKKKKDKDDEDN